MVTAVTIAGCSKDGEESPTPGDDGVLDGQGDNVSCSGTAYTRIDDPGTALCIAGTDSFMCSWGNGNPFVDGYRVQGDHDAAKQELTLSFPDDESYSTFTDFVFATLFGYAGVDLVLDYQGSRSGDYAEVGSWAEAVAGDAGVCGGPTGSANSMPLIADAEWRAAPGTPGDGWMLPGFDDSSWQQAGLPAPDNCGWTMTAESLGRPYEAWEHDGVPTMWAPSSEPVAYLRRVLELPAGAVVTSAMVTTVVDDDHDLYVNGVQVVSDQDGFAGPIQGTDISAALVPGSNVIALVATDAQCCCRWIGLNGTIRWQ